MFDDDFEKAKRKLVFKEVARIMKAHPKNYMEKIPGRDFYHALIRIEDISAIEVKFRGMK